ncbi:vacuolar protein sorting-associated protein [Ophiocordyceps camponoti-floridani]|uniref:Vacuolar protein sorting-associated protein n=1 Tax=Ophiocordyceps camponoti-floridani TaxID=2030778 RepID=A0A8H4VEZ2_9HYPO|nr:vacuolar protein sorting-associated protein [Ophiocordyceps camponoti-floridani]
MVSSTGEGAEPDEAGALSVEELLRQLEHDDQEEWEYEYSATETETFYLTIDLSYPEFKGQSTLVPPHHRGAYYKGETDPTTWADPAVAKDSGRAGGVLSDDEEDAAKDDENEDENDGDNEGEDRVMMDAPAEGGRKDKGKGKEVRPRENDDDDQDKDQDMDEDAPLVDPALKTVVVETESGSRAADKGKQKARDEGAERSYGDENQDDDNQQLEDIQILDLHSPRPLFSYRGRVFEGQWAEVIGTEAILTHHDDKEALPALRQLAEGIDMLAASSSRIVTTEKLVRPKVAQVDTLAPVREEWNIRIPAGKSRTQEKMQQVRFLENLMALKKKKGQEDQVTVFATDGAGKDWNDKHAVDYKPRYRKRTTAMGADDDDDDDDDDTDEEEVEDEDPDSRRRRRLRQQQRRRRRRAARARAASGRWLRGGLVLATVLACFCFLAWFVPRALNPTETSPGRQLEDKLWIETSPYFWDRVAYIAHHLQHMKATDDHGNPLHHGLENINLDGLDHLDAGAHHVNLHSLDDVESPGHKPNSTGHSQAPSTLILVDKGNGILDAFWFFFYSYNLGQTVLGLRFGNHVGDWEHCMVRFQHGVPRGIYLSEHEGGQAYAWSAVEKRGGRPVVYSALGSHAMYALAGNHPYVLPFSLLKDVTDRGPRWDPALNMRAYHYDYLRPLDGLSPAATNPDAPTGWFHYRGRWGDAVYALADSRQWRLFGQYHYVAGPAGPKFKHLERSKLCSGSRCRLLYELDPEGTWY